jgi:glycerol-3-phosphate cytidylyltransferase-like family protein
MCTLVALEEIVKRISYANSELVLRNTRERAFEFLRSITSDLCLIGEDRTEDKMTVKAKVEHKTILVDLQVEKSRINNWWLITMTPYL